MVQLLNGDNYSEDKSFIIIIIIWKNTPVDRVH